MIVLGIESSCDETSVAIVEDAHKILSQVTHSQIDQHNVYGGVVPEIAAREHFLHIDETIWQTLQEADLSWSDIDRLAVSNAPGLVSSLLVGATAAKTLSWLYDIELVAVNHLQAHVCANALSAQPLALPFICLLVSGGHTQLLAVESYEEIGLLGETLDDSVGEAFDKVARLLDLRYPGGPEIEKLSRSGDKERFAFTQPKVNKYQFSFSGLKTAVSRTISKEKAKADNNELSQSDKADLAASFQEVCCRELSDKLLQAAKDLDYQNILIAGGVASNSRLREVLEERSCNSFNFSAPDRRYCTDNAAVVACAGYLCPSEKGIDFGVHSRQSLLCFQQLSK